MILLLLWLAAADPQPAPTATPGAKPTKSADTMVCRTMAVTGSLVNTTKTCKTKREWDADRANLRGGPGVDSCRNAGQGGPC